MMTVTKEQVSQPWLKCRRPAEQTLPDARVLSDVVVSDGKVFFSLTVDAAAVKAWEPVRKRRKRPCAASLVCSRRSLL